MGRNNADFQNGRYVRTSGNAARNVGIIYDPQGPADGFEERNVDSNIKYGYTVRHHLPKDVPLYTAQGRFDTAGVRHYYDNPSQKLPDPGHVRPIVWRDSQGKHWIKEGHHRIIASRLRGDEAIPVDLSSHIFGRRVDDA